MYTIKHQIMTSKHMNKKEFSTVIWKEGKHYVSQCLNVDISSFGKTRKDALRNLQEALDLYFEDAKTSKIASVERPEIVRMKSTHA